MQSTVWRKKNEKKTTLIMCAWGFQTLVNLKWPARSLWRLEPFPTFQLIHTFSRFYCLSWSIDSWFGYNHNNFMYTFKVYTVCRVENWFSIVTPVIVPFCARAKSIDNRQNEINKQKYIYWRHTKLFRLYLQFEGMESSFDRFHVVVAANEPANPTQPNPTDIESK